MEFFLTDSEFELLRALVFELTGIKMSDVKRQMLKGRLSRRLRALNMTSFQDYYELLQAQPLGPETGEFISAVTTNKTDFYREAHHFTFVTDRVIPEIEARLRMGSRRLRIWHAGCSTGEEAYTMSMALHEALANREPWFVQQLATDIDSRVLEHAVRGEYEIDGLRPVSTELRKHYFLRGRGQKSNLARVRPELAEWLTFRRLNLLVEPWPFAKTTRFDVIFCRNVMIYFDKPTQQRLVERFHDLLEAGGYLFIGHSESLLGIDNGLASLGKTIYQKVGRERKSA